MNNLVVAAFFQRSVAWREYLQLCKPRVVALMLLTAIVGMFLASHGFVPIHILILGTLGIALASGGAAAMNQVLEHHLDAKMRRTAGRPIVRGKISPQRAAIFAVVLCVLGITTLVLWINAITALLTLISLVGYAVIYTVYLKHATPQNIVIGGLAGAAPPLLGWIAVTGRLDPPSLLLTLIIFVWTPPHFWSLAIYRLEDYSKANIPMLPITHGVNYTKNQILLYTILLSAVTLLPFVIGMMGYFYLIATLLLNGRFIYWAIVLWKGPHPKTPLFMFRYSIIYLMLLFVAMLADHYFM